MTLNDYRTLFDLTGQRALVIGAGSGIGQAAALGLAAFGAEVMCADLDRSAAEETASRIRDEGAVAQSAQLDMTDQRAVDALVGELESLEIMVVTPAVNVRKPFLNVSETEFDKVMNLNLKGNFFAMQAAGRRMAGAERGSIILFSSIRSQVVEPGQGIYAATKAGMLQMVRALAAELGDVGVRVNAVAPGVVETPLTEPIKSHPDWYQAYADKSALKRWASSDELVGPVVYLASRASSFVTGSLLMVDGGWTAIDGRFTPPLS